MSIRLLPRRKWLRRIVIGICVTAGALVSFVTFLIAMAGRRYFPPVQIKSTESSTRVIRTAIQHWQDAERTTNCPTIEQLLSENQLTKGDLVVDAWGQPFVLECTKDEIYVTSPGPNRMLGTADDIRIPKRVPYEVAQFAALNEWRDAGRSQCGSLASCISSGN